MVILLSTEEEKMVKLRLKRMGAKKAPIYRIVAADSRFAVTGRDIEVVGIYNPIKDETTIYEEKVMKWLAEGAKPSDTVRDILSKNGIMAKFAASKKAGK